MSVPNEGKCQGCGYIGLRAACRKCPHSVPRPDVQPPPAPEKAAALFEPIGQPGKYKSQKTRYHGIVYDSKKEAHRAWELDTLVIAGAISCLRRQVAFPIEINGEHVFTWIADFVYLVTGEDGSVVEDVKGNRTPMYKLKAKCILAYYGIKILET